MNVTIWQADIKTKYFKLHFRVFSFEILCTSRGCLCTNTGTRAIVWIPVAKWWRMRLVAVFYSCPLLYYRSHTTQLDLENIYFSISPVSPTTFLQSVLSCFSVSQRSHPCCVCSQTITQICAQPQVETQTNPVPMLRRPSIFVVMDWYSKQALRSHES